MRFSYFFKDFPRFFPDFHPIFHPIYAIKILREGPYLPLRYAPGDDAEHFDDLFNCIFPCDFLEKKFSIVYEHNKFVCYQS